MAKLVIGSDKTVGTPAIIKEVPVIPVLETLNVTPSTSAQTILPTSPAEGFDEVDVAAVDSNIDPNILSNNIKNGVTILGITGSYTGEPPTGTINITNNGQHNVSGYATANVQVPTGGSVKYATLRTLDSDGILTADGANLITLDTDVHKLGTSCLSYNYDGANIYSTLNWSSPLSFTLAQGAMNYTFVNATFNNPDVVLSAITATNGGYSLYYTFQNTNIESLDLSGLTVAFGSYAMANMCDGCSALTSVNLSNLGRVGSNGLQSAFRSTALASLSLPNLYEIGSYSLTDVCSGCSSLTSASIPALSYIPMYGLQRAFQNSSLASFDVSNVSQIGQYGLSSAFANTQITTLSFNNLREVNRQAFGSGTGWSGGAFVGLNIELHFPQNMQATIEAMSGYSNKWGATNADIYYDLPDAYRLEDSSGSYYYRIPHFDTSSALAWYQGTDSSVPYYTSGTSMPQPGNDIYTDEQCTEIYESINDVN